MIKEFFQKRKQRKAIAEWHRSALGRALTIHTNEYFTKNARLSAFSDEGKNKIVADFYQQIVNYAQSENPFLAMREGLAGYVIGYAGYQVLCLTEEEKKEASYADCPYISGQLYKYIDRIVDHNDELGELKWKHADISNEELLSFCNTRCVVYLYYLNGMNYVRSEFKDLDEQKDWLRPFLKSMLIWEEDQMREKIGIPRLLPDTLDGLRHSAFMNMVINGHRNPFYEWEKLNRGYESI